MSSMVTFTQEGTRRLPGAQVVFPLHFLLCLSSDINAMVIDESRPDCAALLDLDHRKFDLQSFL